MNREFQQYRFAWIEAQNITRARLKAQFKDGIGGLEEVEKAIEQLIMTEPTCTPWRKSEVERAHGPDQPSPAIWETIPNQGLPVRNSEESLPVFITKNFAF